ncbi:MAG: class I SAM-dependent methyltransferase family protein [bacterium]|nr:class I SAM-dependent methyltransferase family protein [bacterium]
MRILRTIRLATLRFIIRTIGRTSDGIRIAFDEGFTSGRMLDYIYANRPSGRLLIGPLIDRAYLAHAGWEVIRTRKANLERLLRRAIAVQRERGRAPTILDVASGPARYLLDVLADDAGDDLAAVCRDLDEAALELGRRNAARRGVTAVRFVAGDALSADSLAAARPCPTIAVSSGFYDWITDDAVVRRSMALLHDLLPPGGCFLFTNQSGHVDLEMVQAVFLDFRKQPLRMVVRPAAKVNAWAAAAGFTVIETASDAFGHYSVTLAEKP